MPLERLLRARRPRETPRSHVETALRSSRSRHCTARLVIVAEDAIKPHSAIGSASSYLEQWFMLQRRQSAMLASPNAIAAATRQSGLDSRGTSPMYSSEKAPTRIVAMTTITGISRRVGVHRFGSGMVGSISPSRRLQERCLLQSRRRGFQLTRYVVFPMRRC